MANQSIYNAFQQFWTHVLTKVGVGKNVTGIEYTIDDVAVTAGTGAEVFNIYTENENKATGVFSHAEGGETVATGAYSHTEGYSTQALAPCCHAEGSESIASGQCSHAENYKTKASGTSSHAEGQSTIASGQCSHAEGYGATASNSYSHAEGNLTVASGDCSHAEGNSTQASGDFSHTEGYSTTASNQCSHAEGSETAATGKYSHAEGAGTTASGVGSHAEGYFTTALDHQHAQGHHNNTGTAAAGSVQGTSGTAFIIGNGTVSTESNAFRVTYAGAAYGLSSFNSSGADYAEYFEWLDGNPDNEDRRGYFVTMDGEKIKIAAPGDYILGIISALPAVIGNGDEDWQGKFLHDEFGDFIPEEITYTEEKTIQQLNAEGVLEDRKVTVTKHAMSYMVNPDYNPDETYVSRADRPEWDAVGMMGVLAVRDDGTCEVNGFCEVADGGIATASESGYRVIKRVSDNIVKVVFK